MFDKFINKYPDYKIVKTPSKEMLEKYKKIAPKELKIFWENIGIGSFMDGYLKFVEPDDYTDFIREHIILVEEPTFVFAVTALADVISWEKDVIVFHDFRHGKNRVIAPDLDILLNYYLPDDTFFPKALSAKHFLSFKKKVGSPDYDECFGYFPALALGGSEKVENLKRVKLREHLGILAQLIEKN